MLDNAVELKNGPWSVLLVSCCVIRYIAYIEFHAMQRRLSVMPLELVGRVGLMSRLLGVPTKHQS